MAEYYFLSYLKTENGEQKAGLRKFEGTDDSIALAWAKYELSGIDADWGAVCFGDPDALTFRDVGESLRRGKDY